MPVLPFAAETYSREGFGVPKARLINMYSEATPSGPAKEARFPRPGLKRVYTVGTGPILGMYYQDGVLGDQIFQVSGSELYRGTIKVGDVQPGDTFASMDASYDQLAIVTSGVLYCYDGTTYQRVYYFKGTTDALPAFTSVKYIAGRFYLTTYNSDVVWYSDLNDLTKIDGLSFFTAESLPDTNVCIATLADELWIFGTGSVEPWYLTGGADDPAQRSQGRRYEIGAAAKGSVVPLDNTLFFVGSDRLVYRSGNVPQRISTHGIETALQKCARLDLVRSFGLSLSGHKFYVLQVYGVGTYAYDVATGEWAEWQSYNKDSFLPVCCVTKGGISYLGSGEDGTIYSLQDGVYSDDDGPVTYLASCFLPNAGQNVINFSLMLQCSRGLAGGPGIKPPLVEMRYSDDAGQTWSTYRKASLGNMGQYALKAIWRRLGQINSPGRVYEFRTTSYVPIVYEYLTYNQGTP